LFTSHANRPRCGKSVTPPDNLGAGQKESQSRAEPLKKLDVSWPRIRAGDIVAKPLPNIGSMVGECGPLRKRVTGEKAMPSNNWGMSS
jgi:hypothetical protein